MSLTLTVEVPVSFPQGGRGRRKGRLFLAKRETGFARGLSGCYNDASTIPDGRTRGNRVRGDGGLPVRPSAGAQTERWGGAGPVRWLSWR
jgi:hypothetical protein